MSRRDPLVRLRHMLDYAREAVRIRALKHRIDCSIAGTGTMKRTKVKKETQKFSAAVGRALRRAAKVARKTARMHGTPIYIWKDGKVVAIKP